VGIRHQEKSADDFPNARREKRNITVHFALFLLVVIGYTLWVRWPASRFLTAVTKEDVLRVERILNESPELIFSRSLNPFPPFVGDTALHVAVKRRDIKMAELLLARGLSVNIAGDGDFTALHESAFNGDEILTGLLLDRGASVMARSARHGDTPLHVASGRGQLQVAQLLIQHGTPVDVTDDYGETPLMTAADNGHLALVEFLLDAGADPNHRDKHDRDAFYLAAIRCRTDVVKLLRERGAKVRISSHQRGNIRRSGCKEMEVYLSE
jgi:ankyrin repeat protein